MFEEASDVALEMGTAIALIFEQTASGELSMADIEFLKNEVDE
jgi:hypothetical protein